MNEEVLPAAAAALERGEPAALVTDRPRQRIDAAAHRREDAGLRRRPHRRHDRRRLLRERRARQGARGDRHRPPALVQYDLNDDFVAGVRADLRRPDGRLHRSDRAGAALYIIGAGHVGWHLARDSPPTPASASTSSTTARSSPTASASPTPRRSIVDDLAGVAPSRRPAADRLRGDRHARPHPRPRRLRALAARDLALPRA